MGIILEIKKQLPKIYQFINEDDPKNTPIFEALDFCEKNYYPELSYNTIKQRKLIIGDLKEYLSERNLEGLPIGEFTITHAKETMIFIDNKRNIDNNSYNKIIENAIIIFNYFDRNEFILKGRNPFKKIKRKKSKRKISRNLTLTEKEVISNYLRRMIIFYIWLPCYNMDATLDQEHYKN